MPPPGAPRPDDATRDALATWLETRSIAPARRSRIRDARRFIGSIARSTRTRSAICWRSTSMRRRCCRPTIRATASTTSPTCSACRRRCSSATWARPEKISALAVGDPAIAPTDADLSRPLRPDPDAAHRRPAARHPRRHASIHETFPLDGEYVIKPKLLADERRVHPRSGVSASGRNHRRRRSACTWRQSARPRISRHR